MTCERVGTNLPNLSLEKCFMPDGDWYWETWINDKPRQVSGSSKYWSRIAKEVNPYCPEVTNFWRSPNMGMVFREEVVCFEVVDPNGKDLETRYLGTLPVLMQTKYPIHSGVVAVSGMPRLVAPLVVGFSNGKPVKDKVRHPRRSPR